MNLNDPAVLALRNCTGSDVDDFFVDPVEGLTHRQRELCRQCPIRRECIECGYQLPQNAGHFGGMSRADRLRISKEEALRLLDEGSLDAQLGPVATTTSRRP